MAFPSQKQATDFEDSELARGVAPAMSGLRVCLLPSLDNDLSLSEGFSVLDLLIVAVIVFILISLLMTQMFQTQKFVLRNNAAHQFADYLQRARSDSMRRRATNLDEMARLTILNKTLYSVTLDANGDGVLDSPLVVNLADQHLAIGGPFPRTFMFDRLGRTVDVQQNVIPTTAVVLTNGSGRSMIEISETGRPSIDPSQ